MAAILLENLLQFLLALLAVCGFWGTGRMLRKKFITLPDDALGATTDFAIGAWIVWTLVFLVGLAHGYHPWVARALMVLTFIPVILEIRQLPRLNLSQWKPQNGVEVLLYLIAIYVFVMALMGALTTPAAQDALVHHLALPKNLIKAGAMKDFPYDYFSYFPAGMEMLYLYGLLLRGAGTATLFHYFFGVAIFLLLLKGSSFLNISPLARAIASLAIITIPTIWMEMTWAYVDLAITFYITLALLTLLRYRQSANKEWLYIFGFALGGALSIKYTALYAVVIFSLFILFILRDLKMRSLTEIAKGLMVPMLIAFLVSCLWYVRNVIFTGNPLFPFLLNIIPTHNIGWDSERARNVLVMLGRYGGVDKTFFDYLITPIKLSLYAQYESDQFYQGIIGPFFLLSLPLILAIKWVRREVWYLLGFSAAFYFFWLVSSQQIRYLLPIFPGLALAIVMGGEDLFNLMQDRWKAIKYGLITIIMGAFIYNCFTIFQYFNTFKYPQLFFGKIIAADFLRDKFDYYRAYEYINGNTPPDSKVFLISLSNQPYYLERDHFGDAVFEDYTLKKIVSESKDHSEIKAKLKQMGITHLIYRPYIIFSPDTNPFDQEQQDRFVQFLQQDCNKIILNYYTGLFAINP